MIIRVAALKDFRATGLSTTQSGTAFDLGARLSTEKLHAFMHLTQISTARVLVAKVQSATSSGFTSPADRVTFLLTSEIGSTGPAPPTAFSTDHRFWRANFTLSTVGLTTGGSWKGLMEMGLQ